jgi:NAD(P)-dependent dehydrogenase (short-subunit alcohol dehydrogenase family)
MKNLFSVEGKVALVTGGSRGIGESIARAYVSNGARVYVTSRKAEDCKRTADQLAELGECIAVPDDLGTREGIGRVASLVAASEQRLDILVNNAGATWGAPIDDYPEAGWDKVVDLNMKSPFFLTQRLLPLLRAAASAANPARIINIASVNGIHPPDFPTYAYSASKAGCIMLTRHLAKHLAAENILVNAIAPGLFETAMMAAMLERDGDNIRAGIPLGRGGTPEEMGGVALFLASQASGYTTGAVIPCDGGIAEV